MPATAAAWTPTIARLDEIEPSGCLFHVGSPNENFRVRRYGGEQDFVSRLVGTLTPKDVLFDIGACVGLVSIHARRRGAQVIAFEPEPSIRARLKQNLELNDITDVQVVEWAVSDRAGTARLFTDGAHGTSPSFTEHPDRQAIDVVTNAIDAAILAGELPRPTIVKLDVEGAEARVVQGMRELLNSPGRPRRIFMEVHPDFMLGFGDRVDDLTFFLSRCGYLLADEQTREGQLHHIWQAR